MFAASLRRRLNGKPRRRFHAGAEPARGRLQLEPLEDRWLLSAGTASPLSFRTILGRPPASLIPVVQFNYTSPRSPFVVNLGVPVFVLPVFVGSVSLQAVVNWGDGSQSVGTLPSANSVAVNIVGSHAYEPPETPAGASSPPGTGAQTPTPPAVAVTTTVDTARTPEIAPGSGKAFVQISVDGLGDQTPGTGPARIAIQVYFLIGLAAIPDVGLTLDGAFLIDASAAFSDGAEHLPPVPPVPPGPVGQPWKPNPPEPIPGPHPPGFAPHSPSGLSRNQPANFLPANDPNVPAVVTTPEPVRDATLATSLAADSTQEPVVQWLKNRARDLAVLLQPGPDKAGSVDELGMSVEETSPRVVVPSAPVVPVPKRRTDDSSPLRELIFNGPAGEHLFSEDSDRAGWAAVPLPPDALAQEAAVTAAPATYFGQFSPAEEAEQEAALASARGEAAPARRAAGRSYRLLLMVVGYSLWSLCWFRNGKFPGKTGPAAGGPRWVKPSSSPIS